MHLGSHPLRRGRRLGAAAVETAVVMMPLLMFLFGVIEYGRLLMDWNVLNNAVREGCRYAVVNNTSTTVTSDVQSLVTTRMAGQSSNFSSFTITVTGTQNGSSTAINNLVAGDLVTVSASGQYHFMNIIPFVRLPALTISSSCTMVCEGAT